VAAPSGAAAVLAGSALFSPPNGSSVLDLLSPQVR